MSALNARILSRRTIAAQKAEHTRLIKRLADKLARDPNGRIAAILIRARTHGVLVAPSGLTDVPNLSHDVTADLAPFQGYARSNVASGPDDNDPEAICALMLAGYTRAH